MSLNRTASAARFYNQHRQKLMNISICALLIAGVSTATSLEPTKTKKEDKTANNTPSAKTAKPLALSKSAWLRLIRSSVPSLRDPAVMYFLLHLLALTLRAFLSLRVASLDGLLVAALISKKTKKFVRLLLQWMLLGVPAALINSALHYSQSSLAKYLRFNLTNSLTNAYLPDNLEPNYYTLMTLDGRISDPDQRISTDVARLSHATAALPGQMVKPLLDLLLCAGQLFKTGSGGAEGTVALGLLAHFSSILLKFALPSFAKLASERARLEGALRSTHSKVVTNAEEIAFLRGQDRELDTLDRTYYELERFSRSEYKKRAVYDVAHDFIVKYTWGAAGLVLCAAPVFVSKFMGVLHSAEAISAQFITNRRLLVSASDSLGRLILARKFVAQVVGHAFRVGEFQTVLTAIANGESSSTKALQANGEPVVYSDPIMDPSSKGVVRSSSEEIGFYGVPLITPANVALTRLLTFRVKHGQHLLIAGPNGCGKSSLFRVLGGLWPVRAGTLIIPEIDDMFYLPQRAYLSRGTLREQVVYPSTIAEFRARGHTDSQLLEILKVLDLDNLITENMTLALAKNIQVNPWDFVRDWPDELSVGAQQRLAMARLYYHRPKFAVLDECTSAVSPEMEQFMYQHAQELGISILSVAHRTALWHFHDLLLKFDGKGGYYFGKLDAAERLKYEDERLELDKKLREVPFLEERLKQLQTAKLSQEVKRTNSSASMMRLHGASSNNLKHKGRIFEA